MFFHGGKRWWRFFWRVHCLQLFTRRAASCSAARRMRSVIGARISMRVLRIHRWALGFSIMRLLMFCLIDTHGLEMGREGLVMGSIKSALFRVALRFLS